MSTSIAVVDSTVQLKWEITKEAFDKCDFGQAVYSPLFNVKNNKQESTLDLCIFPRGSGETKKNDVEMHLRNRGRVTEVVKYDFAIETPDGYWPTDSVRKCMPFKIPEKKRHFYQTIFGVM